MTHEEFNLIKTLLHKGSLMKNIDIAELPASSKEGYILTPTVIDPTHIAWEFVPDPNYVAPEQDGSYLHPFIYEAGMAVIAESWYTDGNNIWEAISTGVPQDFNDTEYFDVIITGNE